MKCDLLDIITIFSENKILKGDFDKLEKMEPFEQEKDSITLEKVNNLDLYTSSKFKEGYEDYRLKLSSKITSDITSFKEV